MVDVEELMSKIKSGVWSTQDAFNCTRDLEQEYLQSSKTKEWREDYSLAVYFTSYGIFASSYRECVFPMIELCQKLLEDCPNSADQALYYLALMRLYFVTGFQPKIVEYGLKYVETGYANRMNLKSTYNSIVVAFAENDLFEEALYYLEKMIDVTRKDPAAEGVDFWNSDIINEIVYLDSLVYIKIGLGQLDDAADAAKGLEELIKTKVPDDQKSFFDIQKEFTCLYLQLYMQPQSEEVADEFVHYINKLQSSGFAQSGISFCIRYFAEFMKLLLLKNRFSDVIEIGKFLAKSELFTGSTSMIYSLMMKASEQMQNSRHPSEYEQISKRYIEVLEQEQNNYNAMVRSLTQEELRLMRLRKTMARDSLTGCRNRATFEIEGVRYLSDHAEGCLVFIDLDFLKEVNDKYGHESGDQYLLQFAKMMKNALSHNEFLYRYAGDEFIVLSNRSKLKIEMMLDELLMKNPIVFMLQEEGEHNMNYAEIKEYDIANGPGVRMTLFVSGCRHHCKNCFNEIAWDFNYGNLFDETVEDALVEKLNSSVVRGLTLLGGEPLDPSNQPGVLKLLRKVKKQCPGKDIWCYTGYVWEKDVCGWMSEQCPETKEILSLIDVCVDGPFIEARKNISLQFRGSENQRLIDVSKTLQTGEVVLWTE